MKEEEEEEKGRETHRETETETKRRQSVKDRERHTQRDRDRGQKKTISLIFSHFILFCLFHSPSTSSCVLRVNLYFHSKGSVAYKEETKEMQLSRERTKLRCMI